MFFGAGFKLTPAVCFRYSSTFFFTTVFGEEQGATTGWAGVLHYFQWIHKLFRICFM